MTNELTTLISDTLDNSGFVVKTIGNTVEVSLKNRGVSSMEVWATLEFVIPQNKMQTVGGKVIITL